MERNGGRPKILKRSDVFGLELKETTLGLENARVGSEHEAIFVAEERVGFLRPRKDVITIGKRHEPGVSVFVDDGGGALTKRQGDAVPFELGAIKSGCRGSHIVLIAIEDGDFDSDFCGAFPTSGTAGGDGFIVVFEPAAKLEIGDGLTFRANNFSGST